MKKFLIVLSLIFIIGMATTQEVEAVSVDFDYYNISPRFQYLYNESDELIPFEFGISDNFERAEDVEDISLLLRQVRYDGTFVKDLKVLDMNYEIYNSSTAYVTYSTTAVYSTSYGEVIDVYDLNYISIASVYVNGVLISTDYWSLDNSYNIHIDPTYSDVGDSITIAYFKEFSDTYIASATFDWSSIDFQDENIAFYQVVYNGNFILMTGAVMKQPKYDLTYDTYGLEIGEYLVEDDGLPDFSDQNDFTTILDNDEYWILHYRIPEALVNGGYYRVFQVTDIYSNTLEDSFTTNDILTVQGGSDSDFLNSFIIMPLGDSVGNGLLMSNDNYNDRYDTLIYDYEVGSYFIAMVDQYTSNSLEASASVVWNVTQTEIPFELSIFKEEIGIDDLQRLIFYKNDETIAQAYTTTLAQDSISLISYVDNINDLNTTYSSSYYLDDTLVEDDVVNVSWDLEPSFIPYSLDPSDYTITLDESYTVLPETDIEGHIRNLMIYNSMDDMTGSWIFAIFILLIINVILVISTRETIIYVFVNAIIVLLLSYLGIIPMWMIIGIFILIIIGFKASLSGGASYE